MLLCFVAGRQLKGRSREDGKREYDSNSKSKIERVKLTIHHGYFIVFLSRDIHGQRDDHSVEEENDVIPQHYYAKVIAILDNYQGTLYIGEFLESKVDPLARGSWGKLIGNYQGKGFIESKVDTGGEKRYERANKTHSWRHGKSLVMLVKVRDEGIGLTSCERLVRFLKTAKKITRTCFWCTDLVRNNQIRRINLFVVLLVYRSGEKIIGSEEKTERSSVETTRSGRKVKRSGEENTRSEEKTKRSSVETIDLEEKLRDLMKKTLDLELKPRDLEESSDLERKTQDL
ncbi:hypothetical protein Scep_014511 [Stephania cephalantha]|uniref:Uncharacterized protein n=1 Tax=Stephania cephalantha TaxID=152367 RepID=A0AAP0P1S4_9MAGN